MQAAALAVLAYQLRARTCCPKVRSESIALVAVVLAVVCEATES